MKVRRQILLVVILTFVVLPVARSQESTAELWKRMNYSQQILFIKAFHAGIGTFEGQKDSEFVNQLAAIGFFGEPKTDDWYPMIHKINGFYSQPKNDFIPLSIQSSSRLRSSRNPAGHNPIYFEQRGWP